MSVAGCSSWEDFEEAYGPLFSTGEERRCYMSRRDSRRCLKVSSIECDVQTVREIQYFDFLKRRGVKADFLPAYYGAFRNEHFVGFEQECFGPERAELLLHYLNHATLEEIESEERALEPLLQDMIRTNVIISDLHAANIMRVTEGEGVRYVVIDGYGTPEWIPLPNYFRFFGRRKIERQWRKFKERWAQMKLWLPAVRAAQAEREA